MSLPRSKHLVAFLVAAALGAAFAPQALAAHTHRYNRSVSIANDRSSGRLSGQVFSPRPNVCAEGSRVLILQRRDGADKRLASAFAHTNDARWQVRLGGQDGHLLYAKVPRTVIKANGGTTICRAAVSKVVRG